MLKISVLDTKTQRQLIVEGKLIAPWVAEVLHAANGAREGLNGREVVVDVNNVTFISAQGEDVLLKLLRTGVRFRSSGVYVKHVLTRLSRQISREAHK